MIPSINDLLGNVRLSNRWLTCNDKQLATVSLTRVESSVYWTYSWRLDPHIVETIFAEIRSAISNRFDIFDANVKRNYQTSEVTYSIVFRLYSETDAMLLCLHGIEGFKIQIHSAKDDKPYWQNSMKTRKNTIPFKSKHNW